MLSVFESNRSAEPGDVDHIVELPIRGGTRCSHPKPSWEPLFCVGPIPVQIRSLDKPEGGLAGNDTASVAEGVSAFELARLVKVPVGVEVAREVKGPQKKYGFGSVDAPAGSGAIEPGAHQVTAGSLDHARGDREASCDGGAVAHVGCELDHVRCALVDSSAPFQLAEGSAAPHSAGHIARAGTPVRRFSVSHVSAYDA